MNVVGKSVKRLDAEAKVTGKALYPGDYSKSDQLYMKILFAKRPHAIVKSINIDEAMALPGVVAIYVAKDVPNNEYGLIMADQPVLCGPDSTNPYGDRIRFIGDQIALIIAETDDIASKARELIKVKFEDLPIVSEVMEAMKPESPLVHPEKESNIFCHFRIAKGDIEKAFEKCDVIVEQEYNTPVQEHAYLQPEAGLAYLDKEDRITVVVAGQWTHEDQEQIAHSLNLPLEKIRVIYPAIGGAFGGREDMSVQIVLGLAVLRLHQAGIDRPVKIVWNREESILGHHKRHHYVLRSKWGASSSGKILAVEVKIYSDGGAYAYTSTKVLGNATLLATGPYEIENVKVETYAIYTNNIPGGAFRGFGGPQAAFQAEMQINKLAEALQMDPIELRMRNLYREGSIMSVGSPIPKGVTIRETVDLCAREVGWQTTKAGWVKKPEEKQTGHVRKGFGFACGYKNIGFSYGAPENCNARLQLIGSNEIEQAILYHAGAEVGQGSHTAFAQFTAEALGLPFEKVKVVASDTSTSKNSGSASASRLTFMAGNSILGAAKRVLDKWELGERPAEAEYTYRPPATTAFAPDTGECTPNFAYGYVAEAVEVEVDTQTGEIRIINVVCANEVGTAINPEQVQGQIEGAIVQATGYSLLENFIQDKGFVKTSLLSTYLIPTILDIPDKVQSLLLETPDPLGPYGARGMAEMPYLPFAAAVIDAVHSATGIWFYEFPLTPERVLVGLGKL
ncbi:MAG: xanthine dehydrogenase family protein molybdopterin-binding subunit [Anaerolineaceae bacterium]|nr:xanthine dehydrogenase family protein molybdopterin-binding subunit [Anaerolineaceae bacterium]